MLEILWLNKQLNTSTDCVMLLGGFDGLHAGHKTLVQRAKTYGLPIGAMTIFGGKNADSLYTLEERLDIFASAGVDFVFVMPFADIKDYTPEAFVRLLEEKFSIKAYICGDDFRFGHKALGNSQTLKEITAAQVEVVQLLQKDGEKISATTVKQHLSVGEICAANELLAERFFLIGEVVKDRQVGKTLGFPTANIVYPKDKYSIKKGVYETRVMIENKKYKAITNYGARPTFQNERVITETYIDEFDGDLYGRKIKVEFVRYLRDIISFDSVDALILQLSNDLAEVRAND